MYRRRPAANGPPIVPRPVPTAKRCATRLTTLVHNGVMSTTRKVVRQSVSLPADVAKQVRSLANRRRLSANRILVELVEEGIATQKRKRQEFFELAQRFRATADSQEIERLGNELGRMVFGGYADNRNMG